MDNSTLQILLNQKNETLNTSSLYPGKMRATQLMTQKQRLIVDMFVIVACILLTLGGMLANSINIRIFAKISLRDPNTLSLFHLALSDFTMCACACVCILAFALEQVELLSTTLFPLDPNYITVHFANLEELFYFCTTLTTTYIAVVRCFCVAKPLHFRNVFTVSRTIFALIILDLFTLAIFLPMSVSLGTQLEFHPILNVSRVGMRMTSLRVTAQDIKSTVVDIGAAVVTQIIVLICLIVMMVKFKEATKFRHSYSSMMSSPNYQVLKQIILISSLFVICNTPKIIIAFVRFGIPEIDGGQELERYWVLAYEFRLLFETFSSSFNFFIYIKFNSKFREELGLNQGKLKTSGAG